MWLSILLIPTTWHFQYVNCRVLICFLGGSSCDQDSLLYRCGDTDSGLGRATPPRRAASPSGPGSLPIRRKFDDAASESGGSDYSGPR